MHAAVTYPRIRARADVYAEMDLYVQMHVRVDPLCPVTEAMGRKGSSCLLPWMLHAWLLHT